MQEKHGVRESANNVVLITTGGFYELPEVAKTILQENTVCFVQTIAYQELSIFSGSYLFFQP